MYGESEVSENSLPFEKVAASTKLQVPVKKDGEMILRYRGEGEVLIAVISIRASKKQKRSQLVIQVGAQRSFCHVGGLRDGEGLMNVLTFLWWLLVGMEGVEPTWACARRILSPLRLPFRHIPSDAKNATMFEIRGQEPSCLPTPSFRGDR